MTVNEFKQSYESYLSQFFVEDNAVEGVLLNSNIDVNPRIHDEVTLMAVLQGFGQLADMLERTYTPDSQEYIDYKRLLTPTLTTLNKVINPVKLGFSK